jgi:hypothetical protein
MGDGIQWRMAHRQHHDFLGGCMATQHSTKKGPDRAFLRSLILGWTIGRGKAAGRHCSLR